MIHFIKLDFYWKLVQNPYVKLRAFAFFAGYSRSLLNDSIRSHKLSRSTAPWSNGRWNGFRWMAFARILLWIYRVIHFHLCSLFMSVSILTNLSLYASAHSRIHMNVVSVCVCEKVSTKWQLLHAFTIYWCVCQYSWKINKLFCLTTRKYNIWN